MIKNEMPIECTLELGQYQSIVDATNIVSKTNPDGLITYVNSKFLEISGYSREELIGNSHSIIRDPQMDSEVFRELWITIKSKNVWHGVVSNLSKDGTRYTVEASVFPILDDFGEVNEYISIRHDITKLLALSKEVEELHKYNMEQENIAREKLEAGIVNQMNQDECNVLQIPSDVLSGDFYSIYKRKDGSKFIYLLDGQGHGVSPALTVFAISSILNKFVESIESLDHLIEELCPTVKTFLGEIEQLSYIMMMISPDSKSLTYVSGGMYPFYIKRKDEIIKVKSNNIPLMNFSEVPLASTIEIEDWESILLYSDGAVEHEIESLQKYTPLNLINEPSIIKTAIQEIACHKYEDDVTMIHLKNKEG